jgi:pimeloyl-ACP methyl ester carboxylesterase
MQAWTRLIQQGISAVVRPPRREYDVNAIPTVFTTSSGQKILRLPLELENSRGQRLIGSLYRSEQSVNIANSPCVVYLHGNASCQTEGQFLAPNLCPYGVHVLLFDFIGCGHSDGDYVSLGFRESEDLDFMLNYMIMQFGTSQFVLWGRSMGAATALLCSHPNIAGLIIDSGYTSIRAVCTGIAVSQGMPKWVCPFLIWFLSLCVYDIADFDLYTVRPKNACNRAVNPPLILGHAPDDQFVPYRLGEKLFRIYSNLDKEFMELEHGHNGVRSDAWLNKCFNFIFEKLDIDQEGFRLIRLDGPDARAHHFADAGSMMDSYGVL